MPIRLDQIQTGAGQGGYANSQTSKKIANPVQSSGTSLRLDQIPKTGAAVQPTAPEQAPAVTTEKSPISFWQRLKFSFGDRGGKKKLLEQMGYKVYDAADGNFVLSKDGQVSNFDEKGWSLKDLADMAGEALPIGGALGGGALGSLATPVTGGASIYAGGAAGAGLGETAKETIGRGLGVREEGLSAKDIGLQTLGGGLGMAGAGKGAQILGKVLGPTIAKKIGLQVGTGELAGQFATQGRSLLAPIFKGAPLAEATKGIGGRIASEAVEGAIGGALQAGGVTALQTRGDIGATLKAAGEGTLIGTGFGALLGPFIPGGRLKAAARIEPPGKGPPAPPPGGTLPPKGSNLDLLGKTSKFSDEQIIQLSENAEIKKANGEILTPEEDAVYFASRNTLREAISKKAVDPGVKLNTQEERMFGLYQEKISADTARRIAIMQENMNPSKDIVTRGDTPQNVHATIEEALLAPNPTPEQKRIISRIIKREKEIMGDIAKSKGPDNYLKNTEQDKVLMEYEQMINPAVPTQAAAISPGAELPAVPPVERPQIATLAAAPTETMVPGRDITAHERTPEELAQFAKEGGVPEDTLTTRTENIDLLIGRNETLKEFYSDLGVLALDKTQNIDGIIKQMAQIYPEFTPQEVRTMVGDYMQFAPSTLAEKARMDDFIEAELNKRLDEVTAISEGAGQEVVPAESLEIPGELAPVGGRYEKAIARDLEKRISDARFYGKDFPYSWYRYETYLQYEKAKALGNILPNKKLDKIFKGVRKELVDIADDTLSLEIDGKKLSALDYVRAKFAEIRAPETGVTHTYNIARDMWKDTKFGTLVRVLQKWRKFRGFRFIADGPPLVTDASGRDITKQVLRDLMENKLGRIDALGAPYPKDLEAFVVAAMDAEGIPNPDMAGSRAKFVRWQQENLPKIQQSGESSGDILKALELVPEERLTPEQEILLEETRKKLGVGVELGQEKKPIEFKRFFTSDRPRKGRVSLEEEMAVKEQKLEERLRKGKPSRVTGKGPLTPGELERAIFKRKWAKVFGKEYKTPLITAGTKEASLNPEDFRARIDPENQLSDSEFLTQYAQEGGFRSADHFLNKINKLASEGDSPMAENLKSNLSDEQIKEAWGVAKSGEAELAVAGTEKPVTPQGIVPSTFKIGDREYSIKTGVQIADPRATLARYLQSRPGELTGRAPETGTPQARLAATGEIPPTTPELAEGIIKELDNIPDTLLPTGRPSFRESGGRKVNINDPKKAGIFTQVGNEVKTAMTFGDLSHLLRQLIMVGPRHPEIFAAAFPKSFKFLFSEEAFSRAWKIMESDPAYIQASRETPTFFSKLEGPLAGKEEQFMSNWLKKVPILGRVIKASERAFTGVSNMVRLDIYKKLLKERGPAAIGDTEGAVKIRRQIAELVGALTGRGILDSQGIVNRNREFFNSFFFSPGLVKSRVYFLDPRTYLDPKIDPFVRKEAFKSALAFAGTMTTILGLAAASGIKVGTDTNSSDFAKMRFGKTRIDLLGGFQQYIVALSRLITSNYTTSKGKKIDLTAGGPISKYDVALRFLENKEAPIYSFLTTMLKGTSFDGKPVKVQDEILQRITPIVVQDLIDIAQEDPSLLPAGILAFLGAGVQTYK